METTALSTGSIVGISILVLICLVYAGIGIAMFLKHRREEQESDYVKRMDDDDYHNNLFL